MLIMDSKKLILISMLIGFLIASFYLMFTDTKEVGTDDSGTLSAELIRFHVVANSDSKEDQELKNRVKNEVLKYLEKEMKETTTKEEAVIFLNAKTEDIKNAARGLIESENKDFDVFVYLDKEEFPIKQYQNMVVPQGKYDALKVVIGSGEGHNWWCVMYPSLCFTDESYSIVDETNSKDLKEILSNDDYNKLVNENIENMEVKYSFKLLNIIK